jgi:hypothetical protein
MEVFPAVQGTRYPVSSLPEPIPDAGAFTSPVFEGELRSHHPSPVVELLAKDLCVEPIGGCLQGFLIGHPQKGFAKVSIGPSGDTCFDNKIIGQRLMEIKISNIFG